LGEDEKLNKRKQKSENKTCLAQGETLPQRKLEDILQAILHFRGGREKKKKNNASIVRHKERTKRCGGVGGNERRFS